MSNLQDVWKKYKEHLKKSHIDKKINDEWKDLWANESLFVVKYGEPGNAGYEEEKHIGRDKIVNFFKGGIEKIEINFNDDGFVYESKNKPDTFLRLG